MSVTLGELPFGAEQLPAIAPGIETSFKEALAGWRKMTPEQREQTKSAYLFFERSRN